MLTLPKNVQLWLPSYIGNRAKRLLSHSPAKRLWVAFTDHFEPMGGKVSVETGLRRVEAWEQRWPEIAEQAPCDHAGKAPCFTFFYPQEEYVHSVVERLAALTRSGTADMEVHLHHFEDNGSSFRRKLEIFKRQLHEEHGLLHTLDGELVFGFIHGNWALDNSHPTGYGCGVKGELQILRDLGCYADFTMPSLPSPTQSRIVNRIYWTTGNPELPRGFDHGIEACIGGGRQGDMLMITGPAGLRYRDRLLPRLEMGEVACYDLPTLHRSRRWLELAPRIGEDIFLKLYGHSAREDNANALLGDSRNPGGLTTLFECVHRVAQEKDLELHWVSAFEMFRAVNALVMRGAVTPSPQIARAQR